MRVPVTLKDDAVVVPFVVELLPAKLATATGRVR
jgi:hypothetical protein